VDAAEARALRLAIEGAPLGESCGAFADPTRALACLQEWLGEGWLASP
jgi:hypothetical protein